MTALTKERSTDERAGIKFSDPLAASTKIYAGSLVCLDSSGNAIPGKTATDLVARGRAETTVDNSNGSAGDLFVEVKQGVFQFANSASTDEVKRTHIDSDCYIVDDQTVAATDGSASRSKAGTVVDVDDDGVWVRIS